MHPIHKHMSSRMKARKSDERYDAKMAYDKNLSGKARLHYLENDIADKGMSMKAPMEMGHEAPSMKAPMKKEGPKQERKDLMKDNPVVKDASGRRPAPRPGRKVEPKKPSKRKLSLKDFTEKPGTGRRYGG